MNFEPTADRLLPELDIRTEMVLLARTLWREGYDDHLAGHITVNQGDGTLLCNPWLLTWEEFRPQDVIRIDLEGNVVEGDWPVPLGIPLHLELHRARPDVQVAVHHHPRWGTVWADLGRLPGRHDQSSVLGGGTAALVDEYGGAVNDPSSAAKAIAAMGDAELAILAHHGVFILGRLHPGRSPAGRGLRVPLPHGVADRGRRWWRRATARRPGLLRGRQRRGLPRLLGGGRPPRAPGRSQPAT